MEPEKMISTSKGSGSANQETNSTSVEGSGSGSQETNFTSVESSASEEIPRADEIEDPVPEIPSDVNLSLSTALTGVDDPVPLSEELFPGIPNDVTLAHLVTKFPGSDIQGLSTLNKAWRGVIQGGEAYRERIRLRSTETLVAIKHVDENFPVSPKYTVSLYSMRDKTFYLLPRVPHRRGISRFSQFISRDGKLYAGMTNCVCDCHICTRNSTERICRAEFARGVYVLDLAGQGQWERCPAGFPPTVTNLQCEGRLSSGSYGRIEGTMFGQGGCRHQFNSLWRTSTATAGGEHLRYVASPSTALALDSMPRKFWMIEGNVYCTTTEGKHHVIYAYDVGRRLWTFQQSIAYGGVPEIERQLRVDSGVDISLGKDHSLTFDPVSILYVNRELLAIAMWRTGDSSGYILLQSKGFGSQEREIAWEKVPNTFTIDVQATLAMCPIQL